MDENKSSRVISVVIEGNKEELDKLNVEAIAERIHRVVHGEKVEALVGTEIETKSTCGIVGEGGCICR
ncbi:hypothetical protein M3226_02585 [Neobacillus cucumis]|uniref:hypothetical protein n=1 Tax=Neobacillus cucumis TaxID=1740721 RepID=UPI00203D2BC4|nr:hypothetical protein [Neobacillus cucumis]MCM3724588.1 hypothetical protein [Neobacillus cucumis]